MQRHHLNKHLHPTNICFLGRNKDLKGENEQGAADTIITQAEPAEFYAEADSRNTEYQYKQDKEGTTQNDR